MEEKGEEIIDERWGTDEEERINFSRNSYVEYDRSSMSSSMRMHEDDTCSIASKDQYDHESRISKEGERVESSQQLHEDKSDEQEKFEDTNISKEIDVNQTTSVNFRIFNTYLPPIYYPLSSIYQYI